MGTDYQPPQISSSSTPLDDIHTSQMLRMMENEMSKGRSKGGSSNAIETMLEQITSTSKNIMVKRAEILENADK